MSIRLPLLCSPRHLIAFCGLLAAGLVTGGIIMARTMNLAACPLCILQRMGYLLLAAETLLAWPLIQRSIGRGLPAFLMALTAIAGASIAGYQTWLQRFAKGVSCTANQPWWEEFVDWAGSQIPLLFEATGLCSEAGWKFIGLSIAEWSLVAFSVMAVVLLRAAVLLQKQPLNDSTMQ